MTQLIDRRRLSGVLGALALIGARAAGAQTAPSFEGTWGGAQGGVSAQVIIAGGSVIGFYWRDDYLDTQGAALSADGKSLSFTFKGGAAALTRTGERTASLAVSEGGRVSRLNLQRD
jgi:hypothetical protein